MEKDFKDYPPDIADYLRAYTKELSVADLRARYKQFKTVV